MKLKSHRLLVTIKVDPAFRPSDVSTYVREALTSHKSDPLLLLGRQHVKVRAIKK